MEQAVEMFLNGARFRRLFEKEYTEVREKYNLLKIDIQILQYLHSAGERNTSKDIVDCGLFTKGHVSQSLNRLHNKNFIEMMQDTNDRRCIHIYLKDEAKEVVEEVRKVHSWIFEVVFRDIPEEDLRHLSRIAAKINENIHDEIMNLTE